MFFVHTTFRQRLANGVDAPRASCLKTTSGPFTSRERAELYAASVANQTAVLSSTISEQEEEKDGNT